jgi:ketosteroid isomerase-like protein
MARRRSRACEEQCRLLSRSLGKSFSDCASFEFELLAYDVVGDMAYTAGFEHTSASVDGQPRTYTLRATQVYRREEASGGWRIAMGAP